MSCLVCPTRYAAELRFPRWRTDDAKHGCAAPVEGTSMAFAPSAVVMPSMAALHFRGNVICNCLSSANNPWTSSKLESRAMMVAERYAT